MAQNDDLKVFHAEEITNSDSTYVVPTDATAIQQIGNTRNPDFINVSTAGEYHLRLESGVACDNIYLNAGWNAIPFLQFLTGGAGTAARAGWKKSK